MVIGNNNDQSPVRRIQSLYYQMAFRVRKWAIN